MTDQTSKPLSAAFPNGRVISYEWGDIDEAVANVQRARNTDDLAGPHVWARYATILCAELMRTREERDLALAHDTQPYPTAWAYEQACRVLEETKGLTVDLARAGSDYADATQALEIEMRGKPGRVYGQMLSWPRYDAARTKWSETIARIGRKAAGG